MFVSLIIFHMFVYQQMSAEELKKVKRKLEKKMKQIQALEKKESLSPEEVWLISDRY